MTAAAPAPRAASIRERMAETMIETTACAGGCTEADLRVAGFSAAQIARFGADAAREAAARVAP
ncbi:MAG: hypothetical protein R3184_03615 [Aurantimonas coralicida]|nr:hypothetical protein [Aurantimonas coralicida]